MDVCVPQKLSIEAQAWSPVLSSGVQHLEQADPVVGAPAKCICGVGVSQRADMAMLLEGRAPAPPFRLVVSLGHLSWALSPLLCSQLRLGVS